MNHSAAVELIQADTSSHQLPLFICAALVFQKWSKTMNKLWCWLCCTSKKSRRGRGRWEAGSLPGKRGHHDTLILEKWDWHEHIFENWHYARTLDLRWLYTARWMWCGHSAGLPMAVHSTTTPKLPEDQNSILPTDHHYKNGLLNLWQDELKIYSNFIYF